MTFKYDIKSKTADKNEIRMLNYDEEKEPALANKNYLSLLYLQQNWPVICDNNMNWLQRFCGQILMYGEVPKHVAFILDGNRRYAKKNHIEKYEGHLRGFNKMMDMLQWCIYLGIKDITVYMFSLDNFKRTQEEIYGIFEIFRIKMRNFIKERDKLKKQGICVRIIGNLKYVPHDIAKIIAEVMLVTKQNNKTILNIALCYTGRDELTNAFKHISNGIKNNEIDEKDLSIDIIDNCLYSYPSPPPDLLIRTSGETRLSDFMIWQCSYTYMYFSQLLWPEFTVWDLMTAIFMYQRNVGQLIRFKSPTKAMSSRAKEFAENVKKRRLNCIYTTMR